jgi:hypothetical protein
MRWEKEGHPSAQLPIGAYRLWNLDVVVAVHLGVDGLATDFEHAPNTAAGGARSQIPALWQVLAEKGLQCHCIDIATVLISRKGPKVVDQEAGDDFLGK